MSFLLNHRDLCLHCFVKFVGGTEVVKFLVFNCFPMEFCAPVVRYVSDAAESPLELGDSTRSVEVCDQNLEG